MLAAVGAKYTDAGVVPAHKHPANVASWRMLLRGATKEANDRRRENPSSAEQWHVAPLLREDVVAMLCAHLPTTPRMDACVATVLLALDGQFAARDLAHLEAGEVQRTDAGGVRVKDQVFDCDHGERVRGVPWDCTACAVARVMSRHSGGSGPLLAGASEGDLVVATARRLAGLRSRPWDGAPLNRATSGWRATRLTPGGDLDPWQAAGFRRACVLMAGRRGEAGSWLRARAWTAMAWTCGFRMCGDLLRLERSAVSASTLR